MQTKKNNTGFESYQVTPKLYGVVFSSAIVIILLVIFYLVATSQSNVETDLEIENSTTIDNPTEITFEETILDNAAFQINYSIPTGNSPIEIIARDNIESNVQDFIDQAHEDRNIELAERGELPEFLQRPYSLTISNQYYSNEQMQYQSIVSQTAAYTGGANGYTYYNVYTLDKDNNRIRGLADIINTVDRRVIKELVVDALETKEFGDTFGSSVLFPEALQNLNLEDVAVGFDNDNVVLYFDEYQVGPGVIGAFFVEIPLIEIEQYLINYR